MFMVVDDDWLDVVIVVCRSSASSVMVASAGRIAPLQHWRFVVPLVGEATQLGTRAMALAHSSPSATTWLRIPAADLLEAARESEQCSGTVDVARHRCGEGGGGQGRDAVSLSDSISSSSDQCMEEGTSNR